MKLQGKEYYYLAVTPDQYELPLYVAEYLSELARVMNVKEYTISNMLVHPELYSGERIGMRFYRIEVTENV